LSRGLPFQFLIPSRREVLQFVQIGTGERVLHWLHRWSAHSLVSVISRWMQAPNILIVGLMVNVLLLMVIVLLKNVALLFPAISMLPREYPRVCKSVLYCWVRLIAVWIEFVTMKPSSAQWAL